MQGAIAGHLHPDPHEDDGENSLGNHFQAHTQDKKVTGSR